jgi:hypothetical protein
MVVAALAATLFMPVETRQGVDFQVTMYEVPLYAKTLDFLHRDINYERLVGRLVDSESSAEAKALGLFEWTRENIRDTPPGFPVVDDHIWNIIVRGYGEDDQKADVFTTLATYAGAPAFWTSGGKLSDNLVLSYVWLEDDWRVFDVENGIVFRNPDGELAGTEDLVNDSRIVALAAGELTYRSRPYHSYFANYNPPAAPYTLRAELQMPMKRVWLPLMERMGIVWREWGE